MESTCKILSNIGPKVATTLVHLQLKANWYYTTNCEKSDTGGLTIFMECAGLLPLKLANNWYQLPE